MKTLLILVLFGIGCGEVDAIHVPDAGDDATAVGGKGGSAGTGVDAAGGHEVDVDHDASRDTLFAHDAGTDTAVSRDAEVDGPCVPLGCWVCINGVRMIPVGTCM